MKRTLTTLALSLLALSACEQKDTTAPPAPVVDPVASPTPLTKVSLTGSAEFGATVTISGGDAAVETKADRFTARWRAEVTLKADQDNAMSVTATDAAGNVSDATTLTVTQSPSKPTSLKLSLTSTLARAGELVGLVTRVLDQYGNEMPDAAVTFESTPALAASFTVPGSTMMKDQGVLAGTKQFVAYDLSAVKDAGYTFALKATAGAATDTQVVTVRPAPAQSFSQLAWVPMGTSLTVRAGEDAAFTYEVIDLYGNVTTGPVSAYSNAPGAIVVDDGITGSGKVARLTATGSYTVSFYIAGVGQKGSLSLGVDTAPAAFVDVTASATLASPQTGVKVFAHVRDAFGNPILCTTANTGDITFDAQGTTTGAVTPGATSCFNGAFVATFTFPAEDNFAVTATWQPTGATAVTGNVFITVLNFDNTPPQIHIDNITVNGTPCTPAQRPSLPGCDVANGDQVEFDAVATDNSALAQVAYSIFFTSTQSTRTRTVFVAANQASATVHFRFGVNSNAIETAPLVAMAVDRAGNIMNSAAVDFFVNMGAAVGARTLSTVATGTNLNRPDDVAFDSGGNLFILNRGNGNILRLAPSATTATVFLNTNPGQFLVNGTVAGVERMWLSDRTTNNGVVRTFDPANAGAGVSVFSTIGGGNGVSSGLAMLHAMPARGWVDVTAGLDGDRVTFTQGGAALAYELDSNATCTASATNVCVSITAGATGNQKATALSAAINATPSTTLTASVNGNRVLVATLATGEPQPGTLVSMSRTGGITLSSPQLAEGHDADLWVGNDGDNAIRRYLGIGGPFGAGTNHGQFNVNTTQWGLAVRDAWQAPTDNLFDTVEYFVDSGNFQTLRAHRTTVIGTGVGTQTTTTPLFAINNFGNGGFNGLWDTALAANGCLLVSDEQGGDIFAVDVRNPTNTTPTVERVARALPGPRGLTLDAMGNLYIAENQGNAVLMLTPTPDPTDCF